MKILLIIIFMLIILFYINNIKENFLSLYTTKLKKIPTIKDNYNYYLYDIIDDTLDDKYYIILENSQIFSGYVLPNNSELVQYVYGHGYIFDLNFDNYRYFIYRSYDVKNEDESYLLSLYFPFNPDSKLQVKNDVVDCKIKINEENNYINLREKLKINF